jgi:SAM-dependent methyltransferase
MNLSEFYKNTNNGSDKGTIHCYIDEWYSNEFTPIKNKELLILEIGINRGDSIILWRDWFINSKIFGIDNKISMTSECIDIVNNIKNVNIVYGDAYSDKIVNLYSDETFDYIIDDGPHTLESQLNCVKKWFSKLKPNGKIIIEDVMGFCELKKIKFDNLNIPYQILDLRNKSNQLDDILLIFKKQK